MSEEILKALTQLFAIITKQDEGVTAVERSFVERFFNSRLNQDSVGEYISLYEGFLVDKKRKSRREKEGDKEKQKSTPETEEKSERKTKLTSMKDSVRTLAICKKINKTLTQKQKAIVLVELLELVNSDKNFTPQRKQIINTVSTVFNIEKDEYDCLENFVLEEDVSLFNKEAFLICSAVPVTNEHSHYIHSDNLDGQFVFLKVESVDLYFVKYMGTDEVILNSDILTNYHIQLFSYGSTLKPAKGASIYYSDLVSHFNNAHTATPISFNCKHLEFKFPNGAIGLRDVNITENRGQLIGIMGASGAGKTTLLNVLAGIESPSKGEVLINGLNIHTQKDKVHGVIGYIAQDDLLMEDLTVFENLYYNAKLCFKGTPEDEINSLVQNILENLGLDHIRDLKVGNVLNKKISGGQRKRLNIALELIREPAVMFVDEPTSGLSSRDSENVIDLLKELSLKGKLIFVVIHQPSSDIYKKFDKMFLMDTGGYPIYYGNPIEAVVYFKQATLQINSDRGQCPDCGNVNPEQIFDIIEARVVNEYGKLTSKRKTTPTQWSDLYNEKFKVNFFEDIPEAPPSTLKIPNKFNQWLIYTIRDLKSKISNKQYLLINLLEGPLLAALLAFIIRYHDAPNGDGYLFRYNENVPAYILISIVVALFMGLSVSAEEIIRDRKIAKREQFLNLSKTSYLFSKISILFMLSAIQTISFTLIGNSILGISGMTTTFWVILFSTSCFANMLGLNISASFNSAITVYILIPLLLIPQMILSGALFNFDKLNSLIAAKDKTPIIADMMASRWAYEAITVQQFKTNEYEDIYFDFDKQISQANFVQAYIIPELENVLNECAAKNEDTSAAAKAIIDQNLVLLRNELLKLNEAKPEVTFNFKASLDSLNYTVGLYVNSFNYITEVAKAYSVDYSKLTTTKDKLSNIRNKNYKSESGKTLEDIKDYSFNESLDEIVRNINTTNRVEQYKGTLVQHLDPIYKSPKPKHALDYRSHLFAPEKHFAGNFVDTFSFNVIVIWLMSLILYFTLYFEVFKKTLNSFENLRFKKNEEHS